MISIRIAGELKHSLVNGPGIRYVVFFQGCPHHCPGCQNPDTHDARGGIECTPSEVLERIRSTKLIDGVTLSGGDPFFQPEACAEIARGAKAMGLSVWAYTGWTYEELISGKAAFVLKEIDALVDGKYDSSLHSENCLWRGSTNQRIIDVQASLEQGTPIAWKEH